MGLESGIILVHFVKHQFGVVIAKPENLELPCSRFVFEAAITVRHQQRQDFIDASRRNLSRPDNRQLGHIPLPFVPG